MATRGTVCYLRRDGQVLLQLKAEGRFGGGLWNAPGGKIEAGESPADATVREMREETGLTVRDLFEHGTLTFFFGETAEPDYTVHIFSTSAFGGALQPNDEGPLEWHPEAALPYERMWPDDTVWLPHLLAGHRFHGEFRLSSDLTRVIEHELRLDGEPTTLDPAIRRRPPPEALRWVERAVGSRARVTSLRRLRGGYSTAVHAVNVVDRRGRAHRLVLRRFVHAAWLAREPDLAEREARVLELLADSDVPAPQLVAVDATGETCDVPGVLMSRLSGRVVFAPDDTEPWLHQMAEALPAVHAVDSSAARLVQPYKRYHDMTNFEPPHWSKAPRAWGRAIEVVNGPPPETAPRFIHRDYHPGNVLWSRGRLTGVIDWINASWGPPGIDIAHCRTNLAQLHGVEAVDAFLAACRSLGIVDDGQPYWDFVSLLDMGSLAERDVYAGWHDAGLRHLSTSLVRARLDEYVTGLVGRL
jgi:aminoglycoside phosphotransferase (APT) family kinase protein/8-oxo-dGTP pyrophosphatase MutT (NUDIX family)